MTEINTSNENLNMNFENLLKPPVNRDMKELDRSFFVKEIPLLAAKFEDPKLIGKFCKVAVKDLLHIPRLNHIQKLNEENNSIIKKCVLFNPNIKEFSNLSDQVKDFLQSNSLGIKLIPYNLELKYDYWKTDDILNSILPVNLKDSAPAGFTVAGHIAHLNLREEYLPFKNIIGEIILDKNPIIQTVVNKTDSIDTKFRTFKMELLAGKDDLMVKNLIESNCRFSFDFSKVYWNSRLQFEHERLISLLKTGSTLCDVFAGIGPFAIPAAKKGVFVLANDLNPYSYKYLKENAINNKVSTICKSFNLDGEEFIKKSPILQKEFYENLPVFSINKKIGSHGLKDTNNGHAQKRVIIAEYHNSPYISDYVMNLPATAIEFLNAFNGLYSNITDDERSKIELPTIHVYCFHKFPPETEPPSEHERHLDIHKRISSSLGYDIDFNLLNFHYVRAVSPTKGMFCVSFKLPSEVAFQKAK